MSDPKPNESDPAAAEPSETSEAARRARAREGPPPTPFDHPLFLPALLFAGMLWFGYDGWINQDPDMQEHLDFNRYGFGLLTLATAWFGYKGYAEWKEEKAGRESGEASSNDPRS